MDEAEYYLSHELTHLVVGELTFNCMGVELPTWLNEGLAENNQGKPDQEEVDAVILEIESGTLPGLIEIANGFSADGDRARLEYTQSDLVVEYLLQKDGPEKMSDLLSAFQSGLLTDEALQKVYGLGTLELDSAWRQSLGLSGSVPHPETKLTNTLVPTLALWTAAIIPPAKTTPIPSPSLTPEPVSQATPTPNETLSPTATLASPTPTELGTSTTPPRPDPSLPIILDCMGTLIVPTILILFLNQKRRV